MSYQKKFSGLQIPPRWVIGVVGVFLLSCSPPPPQDKEIYGKVTLTEQWLEINLKEPLKPEREISEVVIWFADGANYCAVLQEGKLKLPDGSLVFPEGQIVAQNGTIYELRDAGLSDTGVALGGYISGKRLSLPKDNIYTKVRLRSSKPLECRQIVWRNYNPWDSK